MTEEEIQAAAESDPDNPPLSKADLQRMKRVPNHVIRRVLHLTAEQIRAMPELTVTKIRVGDLSAISTWYHAHSGAHSQVNHHVIESGRFAYCRGCNAELIITD